MADDLLPRRVVPFIDEDGTETPMEVFVEIDVERKVYALLTPAEWAVEVVRAEADDEGGQTITPVEPDVVAALKKEIGDALRKYEVEVHLHDGQLFLKGDPPEEFYDCDTLDLEGEDGEEEQFAIILELDTGDDEFLVIMPTEPELFPVELVDGKGRALSDEELEKLEPVFHRALKDFEEDDEEAEEK